MILGLCAVSPVELHGEATVKNFGNSSCQTEKRAVSAFGSERGSLEVAWSESWNGQKVFPDEKKRILATDRETVHRGEMDG